MKAIIKLSILALAFLLPGIALAHDFEVNGVFYKINGNEAAVTFKGDYVSQYANEYSGSVTIPSSVSNDGTVYDVTLIGDSAFANCYNLTSVSIPNTVTAIDKAAFYNCIALTGITIPNSVTTIGGCAFWSCARLKSLSLGNGLTTIKNDAFRGCSGLTSLTLPNSLTTIETRAFYGCNKLTSIVIPNSVTTMDTFVFYNCTKLTSVTIGTGITALGDLAFNGCTALDTVNFNAISCGDFYSVGGAFHGLNISTLNIGSSVQRIPAHLAKGFTGLTTLTIPNSVTFIGQEAFKNCTGLTDLTLGNSLVDIDTWAFSGCSGLTVLDIPNSVSTIDYGAFLDCSGLTTITIGTGVTGIGSVAFHGCTSLETLNFNAINCEDIPFSETGPFQNESLTTINIGEGVQRIPRMFAKGLPNITSITIPNSVTDIGISAFENCTRLTDVSLGNSVATIDAGAFYGCSGLTSMILPASIRTLQSEAFCECEALDHVYSYILDPRDVIKSYHVFYRSAEDFEVRTLYVPVGTKEIYEDLYDWSDHFGTIIEMGDTPVLVNSIELNETEATMTVNSTLQLTAFLSPADATDKRVTWITCDPDIATVDENGLVTAHAAGSTIIIATTADGSNMSASCDITVTALQGDLSGDGRLSIGDVTVFIEMLLSGQSIPTDIADINGNGVVNIADVTALIANILNGN